MLTYQTHVFLGPSLDSETARQYLWEAHYHPPIQCGDIVRLLRWPVKHIIIIDGLYEQVPAVWHKEIMLAIDQGIEVYGAASMGALRAAELHPYGMIGVGDVFQAFLTNQLNDDDEVAVLHQGVDQHLKPINDAMVNIRVTLEAAYQQQVVDALIKQELIDWCKSQFYPKRSLRQAIDRPESQDRCNKLRLWLAKNGMVDVKRQDAIAVLSHVQELLSQTGAQKIQSTKEKTPYTKFIASMVDEVVGTPFAVTQPWFPIEEKKLAFLAKEKPVDYQLIHELSRLWHNAMNVVDLDNSVESEHYLNYIAEHQLYYPKRLYDFLLQHDYLFPLVKWMLHYTCLAHVSNQQLTTYLPAIAFYFDYDLESGDSLQTTLISWILFFVLLLNHQLNDPQLMIKKTVLNEHLQEIRFWRRYKQYQNSCAEENRSNPLSDVKIILDFIVMYMKVIYIHHGMKDTKLGLAQAPTYYHWIYDAMALYEQQCELSYCPNELMGCTE